MIGLIKEIPEIGGNLEQKLSRYLNEVSLIFEGDLSDPKYRSNLVTFLPTGNFNKTLIATGKTLTLAGIIPLFAFLLLYYKDFSLSFCLDFHPKTRN